MKKIILRGFLLLSTVFATNCFAITIINQNSQSTKYYIADSSLCASAVALNSGELSPGGSVSWTRKLVVHPSKVCVHASGLTSITGDTASNLNNDTCTVKIVNAGFMRGIKVQP